MSSAQGRIRQADRLRRCSLHAAWKACLLTFAGRWSLVLWLTAHRNALTGLLRGLLQESVGDVLLQCAACCAARTCLLDKPANLHEQPLLSAAAQLDVIYEDILFIC